MAGKGSILVFSRRKEGFFSLARMLQDYELTDAYVGMPSREYDQKKVSAMLSAEPPYDLAITTNQAPVLFLYDHGYEDKLLGVSADLEGLLLHNLLPDEVCKDPSLLDRKVAAMIAAYRSR
jgi:hypothetical protein